jgi:uncharacterized protein (TIGR03546 family)
MFWLKIVRDFIKILREGQTPQQVAGGFALGSIVGLSPVFTLQGFVVWVVILMFDVNLSAAMLAFTLFSLIAFLADPLFHLLGFQILVHLPFLQGLWTWMYNAPVAPLTRFNNTVVMGSFVAAILFALPTYIGFKKFVVAYRTSVGSRVEGWKVYQIINRSTLVSWYRKIRDLGG